MFAVIYKMETKPGFQQTFEKAWHQLTKLIAKYEGGLGSRLHKESNLVYIAYAQWPNKETWENSGDKLPPEANEIRKIMRTATEKIETIHTMQIVDDLLQ